MSNETLVTGIFQNADDAAGAVRALLDAGTPRDDISVVAADSAGMEAFGIERQTKMGQGAAIGGGVGGALGALVAGFTAVGAIATGGVGVLAAGPIVAALAGAGAGAAAGGVVGGLIGLGMPEHQIKFYRDAIERGSVLVGVRTSGDRREWVEGVFRRFNVESHGASGTAATSADGATPATLRADAAASPLLHLFLGQLKDTYYAEKRLVGAISEMRMVATDPELAGAFASHLAQTEEHVKRLEQVFDSLGVEAKEQKCPAINGIIAEAKDLMQLDESESQLDAALICAAQKAEHYEIATYGCLCAFAKTLGLHQVAQLLHQTLEEETAADEKLTAIAQRGVNEAAAGRPMVEVSRSRGRPDHLSVTSTSLRSAAPTAGLKQRQGDRDELG